jgi:hypothetical protein
MKKLYFIPFLLMSCGGGLMQSEEQKKAELDSFSIKTYGKTAEERTTELKDSIINATMLDTVGLYKSPIKVIRSIMVKNKYSSYRDVRLVYKNVSKKTITGVKFSWKGTDAFGDPANMGGSVPGYGGGFSDETLKPGKTQSGEWSVSSNDGKKINIAWPFEVAFSDGTKWELK